MEESEKGGINSLREMRSAKSRRNGRRMKRLKNEMKMLRERTRPQQSRVKWGVKMRLKKKLWRRRRNLEGLGWVVDLWV